MRGRRVMRNVLSCTPIGRTARGNAKYWIWMYECGHEDLKQREASGRTASFLLSEGLSVRGKCWTCSVEATQ